MSSNPHREKMCLRVLKKASKVNACPLLEFDSKMSEYKENINTCHHRVCLSLFPEISSNIFFSYKQIKNKTILKIDTLHANHRSKCSMF